MVAAASHHPRVCCAAPAQGRLFIKNVAAPLPDLRSKSSTGEALFIVVHFRVCYEAPHREGFNPLLRPPCAKGAVSVADWGIVLFYNPSDTATPCHLPLHRGGFL